MQFPGKKTEQHGVAPAALERHVGTHDSLTDKPATCRDTRRCVVVGGAGQFDPGQGQGRETPLGEQPDSGGGNPSATSLWGEPVPDQGSSLLTAKAVERGTTSYLLPIPGLDQSKLHFLSLSRADC